MQPHVQFLLPLIALLSFTTADPQAVAAGGGVATTLAASQSPTVGTWGSLYTVGTVTSVSWVVFTQTFASTALGTWSLGATPAAGTIGLGTIGGTVGSTKAKRAMPTLELGSA
ncbi:hypothetical protein BGZ57DRAFT_11829 [Hyaloscypha finlandica]|nr:hypothetical protein BGZ57DRAFT_11829 [Hyaloscypha finlandica]